MVDHPKITVVIPAYNVAAFIGETLASVFAQTLENIEVVAVDDGSSDGTAELLRACSDKRLRVLGQSNRGVSAARNAGLAVARAPYVFFLDADDILLPEALRQMAETLDRMPRHVACFGQHVKIAEDGAELSGRADLRWRSLPAADTLRHLIAKNFIVCGTICARTDAARRVRGFNPALALGEDWEFWCRLALLGNFASMPDTVILKYRQRFASANYRLRTSPLRPNFSAVDAVYANPAIRRRFSAKELSRRKRLAKIDAFWAAARNAFCQGRISEFLTYLAVGALRYPDSILRPRLVYLFVRGLRRINVPILNAKS